MTKKKFRIIVLLMSIALIGIITLQYAMLRDSYIQKELLFDQNVNAALVDVVKRVEKAEAVQFIQKKSNRKNKFIVKTTRIDDIQHRNTRTDKRRSTTDFNKSQKDLLKSIASFERKLSKLERTKQISAQKEYADQLKAVNDSLQELRESFEFSFTDKSFKFDLPNFKFSGDSINGIIFENGKDNFRITSDSIINYSRKRPRAPRSERVEVYDYPEVRSFPPAPPAPPLTINIRPYEHPVVRDYFDNTKKEKIEVIQDLAAELDAIDIPLENRINHILIDTLLKIELQKRGISIPYTINISDNYNKVFFASQPLDSNFNSQDLYTVSLFENSKNTNSAKINIEFPTKNEMLNSAMGSSLGSSVLLLVIIIGCFVYTIYAILKQKKLSDLKNDFINNMTHEFKTPVSTIMLASEALKDPAVLNDEPRVKRLAGIIYDENLRLGEHVERVLNMARMDKGEIKLAMNSVSLHQTLQEAIQHFDLNLQHKNQNIFTNLKASDDLIYADQFHLKNILQNLIDNASKYSMIGSSIFIETSETKTDIFLKVRDQGVGMKREQIKKIFEPFYRVPTGNLHDVKGFGIGLHYVHSILKIMGGKISVKSEVGLGSEFTIQFPKKAL